MESGKVSEATINEYRLREKPLKGREVKDIIRYFKRKCSICDEDYLEALDFHHREPQDKLFNVSQFYTLQNPAHLCGGLGIEALFEEIAKCDVLCANCHRKETYPNRASK